MRWLIASLCSVAIALNYRGVRSARGETWQLSGVSKLVRQVPRPFWEAR